MTGFDSTAPLVDITYRNLGCAAHYKGVVRTRRSYLLCPAEQVAEIMCLDVTDIVVFSTVEVTR